MRRECFDMFETSEDNECFYIKRGIPQREFLSAILSVWRELRT